MLYRGKAASKKPVSSRRAYCTNVSLVLGATSAVCLMWAPFFLLPMIILLVPLLLGLAGALGLLAALFAACAAWRREPSYPVAWLGSLPGAVAALLLAGFYAFSWGLNRA